MSDDRDFKHTCHLCNKPIIKGIFHKEYKFDPKKLGPTDNIFQEFMDDIRKEYQIAGLVTIPIADVICEKNHSCSILGEHITTD